MSLLRAWGPTIVVTVWMLSVAVVGVGFVVATVPCALALALAIPAHRREMSEWRRYGHPRSRRRGT